MDRHVRDSYDARAAEYTALALDSLDREPFDRTWLATFARHAAGSTGVIADLGCGPGHVVHHLAGLGLTAVGYDITPGLIAEARRAFPDAKFELGDIAALDVATSSLGGIVARYSLIHMLPSRLDGVFRSWFRLLEPGAPVLVSFFASPSAEAHGEPFDHQVTTAYQLFPATIAAQLHDVGFCDIEIGVRAPHDGQRPLEHGTVLARTPGV